MKNLKPYLILFSLLTILATSNSCERIKHAINKTGETVGTGATEFFVGVGDGYDKSIQCKLEISSPLIAKGLKNGKFTMTQDTSAAHKNILAAYLIFDQDFKEDITVKVLDEKGQEYGRSKLTVAGKKGDASYFDFAFDKRVDFESKSKFVME